MMVGIGRLLKRGIYYKNLWYVHGSLAVHCFSRTLPITPGSDQTSPGSVTPSLSPVVGWSVHLGDTKSYSSRAVTCEDVKDGLT
jgi:hypothetical protein